MVASVRSKETPEQALHRLAAKARQEGVRLKTDGGTRYWASSVSEPGRWHVVTGYTCDCAGFLSHGRCKHHAALLAALGWLPPVEPEPAPTGRGGINSDPTPRCHACDGLGEIQYTRGTGRGRYVHDWQTCPTCRGAGTRIAA